MIVDRIKKKFRRFNPGTLVTIDHHISLFDPKTGFFVRVSNMHEDPAIVLGGWEHDPRFVRIFITDAMYLIHGEFIRRV